jgi:hypothetical protein
MIAATPETCAVPVIGFWLVVPQSSWTVAWAVKGIWKIFMSEENSQTWRL